MWDSLFLSISHYLKIVRINKNESLLKVQLQCQLKDDILEGLDMPFNVWTVFGNNLCL